MGMARELVNKIQKLRKQVGISIDDQIEIYYDKSQEGQLLSDVLKEHIDQIRSALKVPFLESEKRQSHYVQIGNCEYANPENENEKLLIEIVVPNVAFNETKMNVRITDLYCFQEKLGKLNGEKDFVNDAKSFVQAFSREALRNKVEKDGGVLRFSLNGEKIELVLGEDFYLCGKDMNFTQ